MDKGRAVDGGMNMGYACWAPTQNFHRFVWFVC